MKVLRYHIPFVGAPFTPKVAMPIGAQLLSITHTPPRDIVICYALVDETHPIVVRQFAWVFTDREAPEEVTVTGAVFVGTVVFNAHLFDLGEISIPDISKNK